MSMMLDETTVPDETAKAAGAGVWASGWMRATVALAICAPLLLMRVQLLLAPAPLADFVTYWASGRLFVQGADPYSASAVLALERALGWTNPHVLMMLNPPWVLPFVALVGRLPFVTAYYAWQVVAGPLEAVSAVALWRYYGGERRTAWVALVFLATFLPAGAAEHLGQVTPLIVAGITGFLWAVRRQLYGMAGACLMTLALKPHLLYLVFLAIALWMVKERRWRVGVSAAAVCAGTTAAAIAFNRNVLGYFRGTLSTAMETYCGVGGVLRSIFGVEHGWLQFAPMAVGLGWFAWYWRRHGGQWSWEKNLPLVLLVSICSSPYLWAHDFVVAMPALIALMVTVERDSRRWLMAAAMYLLTQKAIFQVGAVISNPWMARFGLLWLGLYVVGMKSVNGVLPSQSAPDPSTGSGQAIGAGMA
jgi:hypothetical protein